MKSSVRPRHRADAPGGRWVRVIIGLVLTLVWISVAAIGGPYFGRIGEVSSNDRTAFLPASADSTLVDERLSEFLGDDAIPAIVVAQRDGGLTDDDLTAMQDFASTVQEDVRWVNGPASPPVSSEDGEAAQVFVPLDASSDAAEAVAELDAELQDTIPEGVSAYVTGPAGFSADLSGAFSGIDGILLGVALATVLVILVIVYRSPVLPVLVLLTSLTALCAAILVNWHLADAGIVQINGQVQGILFILVIGAATDYSLLYVSRFKEALRLHARAWDATKAAWKGAWEPIVASGGTVIAGLLCLLLSDLSSNRALGPVASVGIGFSILAALTFLPAMLLLAGRVALWPRAPRVDPEHVDESVVEKRGIWPRLAAGIARRPRRIWIGITIALVLGCTGLMGLKAEGVAQSDIILGQSQARDGQNVLGEHFPGGSGSPAQAIVAEAKLAEVADEALTHPGVASAGLAAQDSPTGSIPYDIWKATQSDPRADDRTPFDGVEPTTSQGDVLLQVTLADEADSRAAEQTVTELRDDLRSIDPALLIGGPTATDLDTNTTSIQDREAIVPAVLVVITLILMALLRSILAPLLLLATTVISFGTALGVSSLAFNHIFDFPGADPSVPLYGFVFLVALGIDYNIFLMSRVREESLSHGTREGVRRGLTTTGGVITSAGIVLAATFAALAVIPILFLVQLAVIVAFGVLLDALLVRTLLVPALTHDIGNKVWWPGRLSRMKETPHPGVPSAGALSWTPTRRPTGRTDR
ncbi:MAG: MMPL family transporter [Propionibacteriaceae bacterium]